MRIIPVLLSAGLAIFTLLYCIQSALSVLSQEFGLALVNNSISLSASTAILAIGLPFTGPLSDATGRKPAMITALLLAPICMLLSTMMINWHGILIMCALIELSSDGMATVGMTYLNEEIHSNSVAFSMGLYINGNLVGGMNGRLISGIFMNFFNWRITLVVTGYFVLASALMSRKVLPESCHLRPTSLRSRTLFINLRLHWCDWELPLLFAESFLLMGSLVMLSNYIGYRLMLSSWYASQVMVGLLSLAYLTGTQSSSKAGTMTICYRCGPVMLPPTGVMPFGLLMTLFNSLWLISAGMLLFSAGFFVAYLAASSWIGLRAKCTEGQAFSLYLLGYYLRLSIAGMLGDVSWHNYGWNGVGVLIVLISAIALLVGTRLHRRLYA